MLSSRQILAIRMLIPSMRMGKADFLKSGKVGLASTVGGHSQHLAVEKDLEELGSRKRPN